MKENNENNEDANKVQDYSNKFIERLATTIIMEESFILNVDKQSGKILFSESKSKKPTVKYTQEYSKALFEAHNIKQNSPYKDSQLQYLDPKFHTG